MAKAPDPFHAFVAELFAGVGPVIIRRMFGGAGVFCEGIMFALLADDVIYLKADAALRRELLAQGSAPFIWTRPSDGRQIDLGYVSLPTVALDEPDEAARWARRALGIARSLKRAARRPTRRRTS